MSAFDLRIRDCSSYVCSSDLSRFPDPASWLVDQERRAAFLEEGEHYESRYHLALTWLPTADSAEAAGRSLVDRPDAEKGRDWRGALASFIAESDRALDLFASRSEEHTSELQSLMRNSYAVFCLKKKNKP